MNSRYVKQLLVMFILLIGFYNMVDKSKPYTWLFEKVIKTNLRYIKEHPDLDYNQKMQVKHGFKYALCQYVNENAPEDAIILIPSRDAVYNAKELDNKKGTSASLKNKAYASFYIYPRVFIYPYEKDKNPLWDKITHVLIIDGHGYEYLDYNVPNKSKYQLLPIKHK